MDRALQHLHTLKACDISFFERDLLSHLTGTADVLNSWNADEDLVLAGLFHAVYLQNFSLATNPTMKTA
jgi:(p)ppGpp synthase/HD superfamily hydrolase